MVLAISLQLLLMQWGLLTTLGYALLECIRVYYSPDVIVVIEAYHWISSSFLVLGGLPLNKLIISSSSELWLASSTQMFWLKRFSKLTVSNWLPSASDWIFLLGNSASELHKLTELDCAHSQMTAQLSSTALNSLYCTKLNSTVLSSTLNPRQY